MSTGSNSTPLPEQGMNPIKSGDELRKKIIGELSRVQLYAKDHPYDVTSGDEHDIEFAADNIMELITDLQRQHERELDDAKLIIAAIVHQEISRQRSFCGYREGLVFEKNPPGKDGIVIRLTNNQEGEKHE